MCCENIVINNEFGTDLFDAHVDGWCDLHTGDQLERLGSHSCRSVDLERGWVTVTEVRSVRENDARTQDDVIKQKRHAWFVHTWKQKATSHVT